MIRPIMTKVKNGRYEDAKSKGEDEFTKLELALKLNLIILAISKLELEVKRLQKINKVK